MSVFSERLKNAIDVCGVSISILAERSGMSASMLYKIQSGSRLPDSLETLELLLDAMLCDLPRKTDLIQTYKIERIGNLRYASFMALKNMLAEMADPAPVSQEPRARGPVQIPDVIVGKENVKAAIRFILEQETGRDGGEISLMISPRFTYTFETLLQALSACAPGFQGAHHLFCLKSTATDKARHDNMEHIRVILPKMLRMNHYDPWYCYLPDPDNGTVAFPYFIYTSDIVLLISGDGESAVCLKDPEAHSLFAARFREMRASFQPVMHGDRAGLRDYLLLHHRITERSGGPLVPVTLASEPCILPCLSPAAVAKYTPEGMLDDPEVAEALREYYVNSGNNGCVCFFTVPGLEYLIEHGRLVEIQGPDIPVIEREDVLDAMEEFVRRAKAGNIIPYLFRHEFFLASSRLCLGLYGTKLVTVCEMPKRNAVFFDITEATLGYVLRDYVDNALLLGDVIPPEDSIRIIEMVLHRYRN